MKKKFLCIFFALIMSLSLCACGSKQSGVPGSSGQGGFDTVFSGPTEWESTPQPTEPDTSEDVTGEPTGEPEQNTPVPGKGEAEPAPSETEAPVEQPTDGPVEEPARTIPLLTELVGLSSADATEHVGGFMRGEMLIAWGNPTVTDLGTDTWWHDAWSLSYQDGRDLKSLEVHIRYDDRDGAAKVCECYFRYEGWQDAIWPDMPGSSFMSFVAAQKDMVKVLQRTDGLTRHDYFGLLNDPKGYCTDLDGNYIGDVFYVYEGQNTNVSYILVEYDKTYGTYPTSIKYYSAKDEDGKWVNSPYGLPEDMIYREAEY